MDDKILEILKNIQSDMLEMKNDISSIKIQTTENTQILKALEHSAEVNKAEHDKIINDVAKVQGDTSKIRKDLSFVEQATAKNWKDIAELKIVK